MQFKSVLLVGAAMASLAVASPTVNTPPTVFECTPVSISYGNGTAPYTLLATKPGDTSDRLVTIGTNLQGGSVTWDVNLASGTTFIFYILDSTGASNNSANITVNASPSGDTSCLNGSTSVSQGGSSTAAGGSSGGSSTSAGSSSAATSAASSTQNGSSGSSSTSAASASRTSGSNGASQLTGFSAAVAGAVGVVAAALL